MCNAKSGDRENRGSVEGTLRAPGEVGASQWVTCSLRGEQGVPPASGRATPGLGPGLASGRVTVQVKRRPVCVQCTGRQERCEPKAAIARGRERDQPRNPLHRGRRPVCNGGEGTSGRPSWPGRTRVHSACGGARRDGKRAEPGRSHPHRGQVRRALAPRATGGAVGGWEVGSAQSTGEAGESLAEGRGRQTSASASRRVAGSQRPSTMSPLP